MSGFAHFLRTIFIPLFLAAILYVTLAFFILPFVRRHRSRYGPYLPMPSSVAESTASWRTKLSDALYNLFVPSSWTRYEHHRSADRNGLEHNEDELFDDEEGEGMVGFDPIDERRREALEQRRSMVVEEERRLSREIEEGFKDDSDDDGPNSEIRTTISRSRRPDNVF